SFVVVIILSHCFVTLLFAFFRYTTLFRSKDILVLGELMNKNSQFKGSDGHYAKSASLLTCMPIKQTIGDNISSGGVSIDQLIAQDRKSTRLNSSHVKISYAVFCLKKKKKV